MKKYKKENLFLFNRVVEEKSNINLKADKYYCFFGIYNSDKTRVKDVVTGNIYNVEGNNVVVEENVFAPIELIQYDNNKYINRTYITAKSKTVTDLTQVKILIKKWLIGSNKVKCYFKNCDIFMYSLNDTITLPIIKGVVDELNDCLNNYYSNTQEDGKIKVEKIQKQPVLKQELEY